MKTKFGNAKINNEGYYQITSAKEGNGNKLLHRLIAKEYFGDWIDKPLIDGEKIEIHHIDGNPLNNCVLNLLPLPRSEHRKLHNPKGENHRNYGKKLSEETKQKISKNHYDNSGENHHYYGKSRSEETKMKISKSQNTTGYLNVSKSKDKTCKQGFVWRYCYYEDGKQKAIVSVDINKLKTKVKARGLKWYKFKKND